MAILNRRPMSGTCKPSRRPDVIIAAAYQQPTSSATRQPSRTSAASSGDAFFVRRSEQPAARDKWSRATHWVAGGPSQTGYLASLGQVLLT